MISLSTGEPESRKSLSLGPTVPSASVDTKVSWSVLSEVVIVNPPSGIDTSLFSSTDIIGVVPTVDPNPIIKSSAESSNPT